MTWFDDPDALAPDVVATRSFTITKRGFDIREVRAFLDDIAEELRLLRQGTDDLRRQLAVADERLEAARQLDESQVVAKLGAETVRVLDAARVAAIDITNRAEDDAAGVVRRAEAVAELARVEADAAVDAMLEQARAEAGQLVDEARATARDMVDQARAVRERMLADLGRRRAAVRQQLDALTTERDRLRAALVEVGHAHADALRLLDLPAPELAEPDDADPTPVAGASSPGTADGPGPAATHPPSIERRGDGGRVGPSVAEPAGRVSNAVRVIASSTRAPTDATTDADVAPAVATAAAGSRGGGSEGRGIDDDDGGAGGPGRALARELEVASALLGRRIKRTLADEENALLVELERIDALTDPVTILPTADAQRQHYADAALPPLVAAAAGGADVTRRQWPGVARDVAPGAPRVGDLAEHLGDVIVSRLRDALAAGAGRDGPTSDGGAARRGAGHHDVADPAVVVRGAYRAVRTAEIDGLVGRAVRVAFERGLRSMLAPSTRLEWCSVDETHLVGACPTCAAPPTTEGPVGDGVAPLGDGCPAIPVPVEPLLASVIGRGVTGPAKP